MNTVGKTSARRMRLWPGIIFPVGLTLLLGLAAWQFAVSVASEQERADAAAIRLEGYARMEAGDLSSRARTLTQSLVDSRQSVRQEREKNLRVEIRGVMEAVNRVMGSCLERNRNQASARRDVGQFPSGFEGVKNYLEISRSTPKTDLALAALRACSPELGALLPSGCSLAVIENNATELLSLGGGAQADSAMSVAMSREFIWGDGGESRHWTLHLRLSAPDVQPMPGPDEIAQHLTREMGRIRLDDVLWRGWLVGPTGQTAAVFPVPMGGGGRGDDDMPHFTNLPNEWVEIDGRRLVWLERPVKPAGQELSPAVAVSIARPAPPLDLAEEFWKNQRWTFTLGALALLSLGMWVWFVRNLFTSRRAIPAREAVQKATPRSERPLADRQDEAAPRRRLVRDGTRTRAVPEVEGVIVADLDAEGGMRVAALAAAQAALAARQAEQQPVPVQVRPVALPSGSLFRLQARHRGGKGRPGSRALDRAKSPVLRELASRVRPVINVSAGSAARSAAADENVMKMNLPPQSGWDKVAE